MDSRERELSRSPVRAATPQNKLAEGAFLIQAGSTTRRTVPNMDAEIANMVTASKKCVAYGCHLTRLSLYTHMSQSHGRSNESTQT